MMVHEGPAAVFDREEEALKAILDKRIQSGDVIIIRYEGPRGTGMPEMLATTEALITDPIISKTTALITDGRYSGATRGPCHRPCLPGGSSWRPDCADRGWGSESIPTQRRLDVVGLKA